MKFIPIDSIVVGASRQRREFDMTLLQELVTSISETSYGLLHPIVVRGETLVAGERRLRAIHQIYDLGGAFNCGGSPVPAGLVPVVDIGELPTLDAEEAELEENIRRVDLSWQERAEATTRLANLRGRQAAAADRPAPTTRDITNEVRPDHTPEAGLDATRKELIVSRYLDDPDVKAAPSLQEAFKVLKKKEEVKRNQEVAARVGASFTSASHTLLNVDGETWAKDQPPDQFGVILTDPPYGMGAHEFGDSGVGVSAQAHSYDDSYQSWLEMLDWFAPESWRLAKPSAHLYAFCDLDRFVEFRERMLDAGWKVHRTPLVWHNPDGFRAPWPKQGPQRKYELILFAVKGGLETTALKGDVLEYRKDTALGHPAQKPVPLLVDLLRRSARPDMKVWDPFAGSGSVMEACNELKLSSVSLERDPSAYGVAARRLESFANPQQELPV